MRSLWLQAAILLAVTCCLTRGALPTPKQCSDWKIPKSLENKTMAELLEDFKDHNSSKNHTHKCRELTVTQLIAHALNTTGNTSLTVSTLGLPDPGCLKYFGFTLIEVALQNLEDPDMFPGNKTVKEILYLLFSEATQTVVNNVDGVVDGLEKNSVDLMKTIHHLTRKGHFNPHSQFLQVLCLAVNASDLDQAASRLGIDKDLLVNATFLQMTDYLFTSVDAYQKNLSLACAIRHLHSAKLFLEQLREFLKKERMVWEEKTLRELFATYNASVESRTVFSVIKKVFEGHLNLTFLQFFGERRVSLKLFEYKVVTFAKVTFMSESVMFNFTMKQFFHFLDDYGEVMIQYKENMEMAEKRREKILSRYNCKVDDLMQAPFNKTQSEIRLMKDLDIENHAIRCFFKKYAEDRNITLKELESRSNITNNTLVEYNATVYNFMDILYHISKANILEAIKDQKAVVGIITHYHMLCSDELRKQIRVERHPLVTDWKYLIELEISYFIFQKRWNVSVIYEENIYDFVVDYLKPSSWSTFLKIIGIKNPGSQDFVRVFKKYSFKDLSRFYRLEKYTILRWKLSFFFKFMVEKIENDVDECHVRGKYPCARIHGVECVNFPGGAMCECPSDKNLDKYRGCEDIDECDLKSTSCRNNSHCVNTDGSYECRCNTGFKEVNDTKCEDVNECKKQWNRCVFANAECVNTIGSFTCICRLGSVFSFGRGVCVDIDECKQQPCKAVDHSVCVDLEPYYRCDCPVGFITDRNTSVSQNGPLLNCTDINECVIGKHDCDQHATCTNTLGSYTCKCKEGYVRDGSKCIAEKFFEVDQSKCKTILPREHDTRHHNKKYARLDNPLGFYFNGKTYHKLYIHIDGKISIDKKYKKRTPKKLSSVKKNLLCPFWASAELSKKANSSLRYCEIYAENSDSSSLLTKINKFVTNSTKLSDFQAEWVLIVTWTKMVPSFWKPGWWGSSRPSPYTDERNTFQVVIATSGSNTVLVYLYEDGGMTWDPLGIDVAVGYALKSGSENSFQVDDSFTEKIFRIDRKQFTDPAGNERTGCYVKVFKPQKPTPPTPEDNCLAWIRRTSKRDNKWVEGLPGCPCTLSSMEYDVSFDEFFDGNDVKCYVRRTRSQQRTKSCCYYTDSESYGALVPDSDSRAGRALRYNPNTRPLEYQQHDVNSYDWCCDQSTKYCEDFKQLRPADEGCEDNEEPERPCECRWNFGFRWRRPRRRVIWRFFFGFFFGDPHITTLDGVKYSFNGLGEYVVLETNDKSNRIHGRTKRPPKKDGGLSKATVFSGFSLRSSKNTTVQVFYNDSVAGNLNIGTLNESGHYEQFCINTLKQIRGFFLRRSTKDNITLEVVFDSGLVAKITPGKGFLQISFLIPGNFVNNTRGLLGKMNNDKHDDLMYRNGTTIPIDSTEREIFRYGQTWKVQDDEAMFLNRSGYKEPVYFEAKFVPEFLSECNVTDRMRKVCNNQSECLLDYCLTGDESFANATNKYEEESEKVKKIVENLPPVITVTPKIVHVKAGQRFTVKVTVTDPNKDATTLNSTTLPKNAVFSSGTFEWTPPTGLQKPPKIQFIAKDTNGAVNVKPLEIRYCDCKNGGECDFNTTLKSFANSSLKLVGCKCEANSTGDLCETAVKPCEDDPCFKSVSCAVTQKPFGFKCGSCPAGHEGNGEICSDFDECLNATRNNCTENEKCKNIVGSFKCDCKPGFKRAPNSKNCTDVDECTDIGVNINCKANTKCINTPGSYRCQCKPGYEGHPTTKGCKDIDECHGASKKCFGHHCDNKLGSYKCRCEHGFNLEQKQDKTFQCVDIDECKFPVTNNCSQTCINVPSTFTCGCKEGFKLDSDKRSCSVDPNKKCHESHGCEWKCTNTSKNATCHCRKGFNLASNGKDCEDIDECKGNSGCSQKCDNIKGSYKCLCDKGYKPMDDKRSCKDIDECLQNKGGCSQKCQNKPGKRQCSCKRGYLVPKNNETQCEDIDECKAENKCSKHGQECINRPGGYKCRCKDRHKFSNGKSPCKKSRKYRYKLRCRKLGNRDLVWREDYNDEFSEAYEILREYIIENFDVYFKKVFGESYFGCTVLGFWPGSVMANVTLNFDSNSSVTAGNLTSALQGTSNVGNLVVDPTQSAVTDVDECSDGTNNCHVDATCENVPGSFSCHCKEGYQGDGTDCEAISKKKEDDNKKKIMIILLCTLIPLAVIILVIIIWCCCRRKSKGNLYMSEDDTNNVNLRQTSNGDGTTYYGKGNGRRGSHDYEEPGPGNGSEGTYDLASATYYDNPAAISEKQEAKL